MWLLANITITVGHKFQCAADSKINCKDSKCESNVCRMNNLPIRNSYICKRCGLMQSKMAWLSVLSVAICLCADGKLSIVISVRNG